MSKILCDIIDPSLPIFLGIALHVDNILLVISLKLKLIDTTMNSANNLTRSTIIKVNLQIRMIRPLADAQSTYPYGLAFRIIDMD